MSSTPYLSVVVTTRDDDDVDGGSHLLERLQRFVDCFDEQCRQTGLDAEVIVVDWNRPEQRTHPGAMRLPDPCVCAFRFIDVPPDVHRRMRHADLLQAFPMIARNVGIRRARGRFVLSTSVDAVFSTELIAYLASQPLKPRHLYRVDRHDCDPEVPRDGAVETKLAFCATHQRRVHARSGSYLVDRQGHMVSSGEDIVDGTALRLGQGWHVPEGDAPTSFFRWAGDRAEVIVDAAENDTARRLEIDLEANPYDPRSWVNLKVYDGERAVSRAHVAGRMQLRIPLERVERDGPHRIELRVTETHARPRFHLPVFERRDQLSYRVYAMRVRSESSDESMIAYPLSGWTNANPHSAQTVTSSAEGPVITTDEPMWSYSMHYGMLQAPAGGTYRFDVSCSMLDGRASVGVLNGGRNTWIPASVVVQHDANGTRFSISVELGRNETFWLMFYNVHPDGASRFIIRGTKGSIDPARLAAAPVSGLQSNPLIGRIIAGAGKLASRASRHLAEVFSARRWRTLTSAFADSIARVAAAMVPGRDRIVRASPEYRSIQRALNISREQVRALSPLQDFSTLQLTLRRNRPENLHVNHCGDFQLMAREDWHDLRGYPELEASSENVDSLLSFIAHAAGIEEQLLTTPIYCPQHDLSSGDDRKTLQWRLAERGVPKLDAGTVSIWASQMQWLQRPIIFNGSEWGIGSIELPERTTRSAIASTS